MNANGQLLKTDPNFILESSNNVLITADANKGNKNLQNFTGDVYVHIGVITNLSANSSAWKYVPTFSVWGGTDAKIKCTSIGNNKWTYTIPGNLRTFFGITDPAEKIVKIAILNCEVNIFRHAYFILNILQNFKIYCPIPAWCSNFVSLTVIIHTCLF